MFGEVLHSKSSSHRPGKKEWGVIVRLVNCYKLYFDITTHLVIYLANTLSGYLGFMENLSNEKKHGVCLQINRKEKEKKKIIGKVNRMIPKTVVHFFFGRGVVFYF